MAFIIDRSVKTQRDVRKKNEKKISNLRRGIVTKYGVVQSKRRVSPTSPCRRVRTYVKEVEKCDQMPFTLSKSDIAQSCTQFFFI